MHYKVVFNNLTYTLSTGAGSASVITEKLLVSTSKPVFSHTKYMETLADNVNAVNESLMLMKILQSKNSNDKP